MNENFINVKVDREERPDLDRQYMMYVQATTGSGGWPLNLFLTPNLVPFFGGTYFPPSDAISDNTGNKAGFPSILKLISEKWRDQPKTLENSGKKVVEQLRKAADIVPTGSDHGGDVTRIRSIQKAFLYLESSYDQQFAGFGPGPKFPMPGTISMLLRYWLLWKNLDRDAETPSLGELKQNFDGADGDEASLRAKWRETVAGGMKMANEALNIGLVTMKRMARGGIYDHVGGGFHRYTVDRAWTLPHFEKMLYDQAQLIKLYSEAYLIFEKDVEFKEVVYGCIKYLQERLLCCESGAFYSAEDADSLNLETNKTEEGIAVVWSDQEINELFKKENWTVDDIKVFKYHFTVLPRGNLLNLTKDPHLQDKNVLFKRSTTQVTAEKLSRPHDEVEGIIANGLEILGKYRKDCRPLPGRDEKIVSSWNGLMVSALVSAFRSFREDVHLKMAIKTADFLLDKMTFKNAESGRICLWRSYFNGISSKIEGFAEDYANVIGGLLELYQVTFDKKYLESAEALQESLDEMFRDKGGLGYFDSSHTSINDRLFRIKDDHDGVEPSANSVSAINCVKLNLLTGKKVYSDRFKQIVKLFTKRLDKEPQAMTTLISAIILDSAKPTLLSLNQKNETVLASIWDHFLPHVVIKMEAGPQTNEFTGHVCKGNTCSEPTSDSKLLLKQLGI